MDAAKYVIPWTANVQGVDVRLRPSLHDVPEGVRCSWDPQKLKLTVEFRYFVGDEPLVPSRTFAYKDSIVHPFVGRDSKRLYRFEIENVAPPTDKDQFLKELTETLRAVTQSPPTNRQVGNYRTIDSVVASTGSQIADEIVGAH